MRKILIVGGGVAGLSAGIYSLKNGFQAVICEQNSQAGGNLTGWKRNGYTIDNCVHWLTGTNENSSLYKIWEDLGALGDNIKTYQQDELYTVVHDGEILGMHKNTDILKERMLKFSKGDDKVINEFISVVETLKRVEGTGGASQNKGLNFLSVLKLPSIYKYFSISTSELANKVNSPILKKAFSTFMGKEYSALALAYVYATFSSGNGALPQGGSIKMAKNITKRFLDLGGELMLNKCAERVIIENKKAVGVSFKGGEKIYADYVVLATDAELIYNNLIPFDMPKPLKKRYFDPKLKRVSSVHVAFGCDLASLPFKGDLILSIDGELKEETAIKKLVIREFSHEKSFAPKGKNIIQVTKFCYESEAEAWIELKNYPLAYDTKKQEFASRAQKILESEFPVLNGTLSLIDAWTPATYKRYTLAPSGAYMGFIMPPNYLPTTFKNTVSGVSNLVIASQWLSLVGGLPVGAKNGKLAVDKIVALEKAKQKIEAIKSKKPLNKIFSKT